jgi:hypothetical protein
MAVADCTGVLFICVKPRTSKPENKSSSRPISTSKERIPALEKSKFLFWRGFLSGSDV